ncbi:MAG: endonuclease III [Patescibacteria group bacterium]
MLSTAKPVLAELTKMYKGGGATDLDDPYLTLVATIMSARSRDEQVLKLLPGFLKLFPTVAALAKASEAQVRDTLVGIGMWRQKAKNLSATGKKIVAEFHGKIPKTMEELVTLPGVGRKTASIVMNSSYRIPAIAVDTHVYRVTNRLGWVKTKTPEQTEAALKKVVAPELWRDLNRVMVKFGRYICIPGKPRCWACPVKEYCAFTKKNLTPPKNAVEILEALRKREAELQRLRSVATK